MGKPEPIKQPTDSRVRPLSDYSDRIEIREVEQWESGMIQEQNGKPSPLPWKVDGFRIYDADDNMVAEVKVSHWMSYDQVLANAQYIADALRLKQEEL